MAYTVPTIHEIVPNYFNQPPMPITYHIERPTRVKRKTNRKYSSGSYLDYGYEKESWTNNDFYNGNIRKDIKTKFFSLVFDKYSRGGNPYIYCYSLHYTNVIHIEYKSMVCKMQIKNDDLHVEYSDNLKSYYKSNIRHKAVFELTLLAIFTLADNISEEFLEFIHLTMQHRDNIGHELRHRIIRLLPVFKDVLFSIPSNSATRGRV